MATTLIYATKDQERAALAQIKSIVESLGKDSYLAATFTGCFELAESNINDDFMDNFKEIAEAAEQKHKAAQEEVARLKMELEKEQEWEPCYDKNAVSQYNYDKLKNDYYTEPMSDEEAKNWIYQEFGFAKEKVQILREAKLKEVNRHNQKRPTGEIIDRSPLYNATDWNYVRFSVCGALYECYNDDLQELYW